jgi:MFS family permease
MYLWMGKKHTKTSFSFFLMINEISQFFYVCQQSCRHFSLFLLIIYFLLVPFKLSLKISEKYGRKKALISCAIPQMAAWIVIYCAENSMHLIIARLLHGIAGGGK